MISRLLSTQLFGRKNRFLIWLQICFVPLFKGDYLLLDNKHLSLAPKCKAKLKLFFSTDLFRRFWNALLNTTAKENRHLLWCQSNAQLCTSFQFFELHPYFLLSFQNDRFMSLRICQLVAYCFVTSQYKSTVQYIFCLIVHVGSNRVLKLAWRDVLHASAHTQTLCMTTF